MASDFVSPYAGPTGDLPSGASSVVESSAEDAAEPDGAGDAPRTFRVPRQADGSVAPDDLRAAVADANRMLDQTSRANLWAKMTRRMGSKDCPPLLKERWAAATSKSEKNELFGLYLACGGSVGKMTAVEQVTQSETFKAANSKIWMTEADLDEKFHNQSSKVKAIIKKCLRDPALHRDHPDLPEDKELRQYFVHDVSREVRANGVQKLRTLHWTGHVTGQTAIEMAKCVEELFAVSSTASAPASKDLPAPQPKPRKPAPKKTPKAAESPRKAYVDTMRLRCNDYIAIMRELRSKLGTHEWASALRTAMEAEIKWFESGHDSFAALVGTPYTDTVLDPLVADFRAHATTSKDYIAAADNMLTIKKRKLPVEPVRPPVASESVDAAPVSAGTAPVSAGAA
jgi:hypothetical protein